MVDIQLRNCSEKKAVKSSFGGSIQNALETALALQSSGLLREEMFLYLYGVLNTAKYTRARPTNHLTWVQPCSGSWDPRRRGSQRSGDRRWQSVTSGIPPKTLTEDCTKHAKSRAKAGHVCLERSETATEGGYPVLTPLFWRALCRSPTSKRICLQHFMIWGSVLYFNSSHHCYMSLPARHFWLGSWFCVIVVTFIEFLSGANQEPVSPISFNLWAIPWGNFYFHPHL